MPFDDAYPFLTQMADDLEFDSMVAAADPIEKIYLLSRAPKGERRAFISSYLPAILQDCKPQEAIEYALPLITVLALDDEESVKEALASVLSPLIWWFFSRCQIVPDDLETLQGFASTSTTATISVQVFTPILATLLLSSNSLVVGATRSAIVDLLTRLRTADEREAGLRAPDLDLANFSSPSLDEEEDGTGTYAVGLFKRAERALFRHELLHSVVIELSRLNMDPEPNAGESPEHPVDSPHLRVSSPQERPRSPLMRETVNPYFPLSPPHSTDVPVNSQRPPDFSPRSSSPFSPRSRLKHIEPSNDTPTPPPAPAALGTDLDKSYQTDGELDEETAIGQLSSMSLMAAVAAGGLLDADVQRAFVMEVQRVGRHSSVFYVRLEASLALGALAKVVPEELVLSSLLPLFKALRKDHNWNVRHTVPFALAAILPRLSPEQRRTVALKTLSALSADIYEPVRKSVLESLGEVLYTFHNDPGGPPPELVQMFLGRKEDSDVRTGTRTSPYSAQLSTDTAQSATEAFYTHSERPHICAFNFPAVALTLGPSRWSELREAYLELAQNPSVEVRKTLAASLGELAKIIGADAARKDLVGVWFSCLRFGDDSVRVKAIEIFDTLSPLLSDSDRIRMVGEISAAYGEGVFSQWRERDILLGNLEGYIKLAGREVSSFVKSILLKALDDTVAAVRKAAIRILPHIWHAISWDSSLGQNFRNELYSFSTSPSYKRRAIFVACLHSCAVHLSLNHPLPLSIHDILKFAELLAEDPVIDVRIGIARLLDVISGKHKPSPTFERIRQRLATDSSEEVISYLPKRQHQSCDVPLDGSLEPRFPASRQEYPHPSTFSRPPRLHAAAPPDASLAPIPSRPSLAGASSTSPRTNDDPVSRSMGTERLRCVVEA